MNLLDFPVDTQFCQLDIESYGYNTRHIVYKWEENNQTRVSIDRAKTLPQYNLTAITTWELLSNYVTGNWLVEFFFIKILTPSKYHLREGGVKELKQISEKRGR